MSFTGSTFDTPYLILTALVFSLHGLTVLSARGSASPYTESLRSLHREFDFPSPSKRPCLYGRRFSPAGVGDCIDRGHR